MKPGYIRIIDGIIKFEYYELPRPLKRNYPWDGYHEAHFDRALKEYEASKRTVEVSNDYEITKKGKNFSEFTAIKIKEILEIVENNQPCKAKVNGKATIIELTK